MLDSETLENRAPLCLGYNYQCVVILYYLDNVPSLVPGRQPTMILNKMVNPWAVTNIPFLLSTGQSTV